MTKNVSWVNYTEISYLRIEDHLQTAWQSSANHGNAWQNASLAHDYENHSTTLPEVVALNLGLAKTRVR